MGNCICSSPLPIGQSKKNGIDDHIKIDTYDFIETDYPIFYPDFYSKNTKTFKKFIQKLQQKIMHWYLKFIKYLLL